MLSLNALITESNPLNVFLKTNENKKEKTHLFSQQGTLNETLRHSFGINSWLRLDTLNYVLELHGLACICTHVIL